MISFRIKMTLVAVAAYILTAVSAIAQPGPTPPFNVKFYGAPTIGVGGVTTLDLTINNPGAVNLTAVTGSDTLPRYSRY